MLDYINPQLFQQNCDIMSFPISYPLQMPSKWFIMYHLHLVFKQKIFKEFCNICVDFKNISISFLLEQWWCALKDWLCFTKKLKKVERCFTVNQSFLTFSFKIPQILTSIPKSSEKPLFLLWHRKTQSPATVVKWHRTLMPSRFQLTNLPEPQWDAHFIATKISPGWGHHWLFERSRSLPAATQLCSVMFGHHTQSCTVQLLCCQHCPSTFVTSGQLALCHC